MHRNIKPGTTVHEKFLELKSGKVGVIKAQNKLMTPDGKQIGTEVFTIESQPPVKSAISIFRSRFRLHTGSW